MQSKFAEIIIVVHLYGQSVRRESYLLEPVKHVKEYCSIFLERFTATRINGGRVYANYWRWAADERRGAFLLIGSRENVLISRILNRELSLSSAGSLFASLVRHTLSTRPNDTSAGDKRRSSLERSFTFFPPCFSWIIPQLYHSAWTVSTGQLITVVLFTFLCM